MTVLLVQSTSPRLGEMRCLLTGSPEYRQAWHEVESVKFSQRPLPTYSKEEPQQKHPFLEAYEADQKRREERRKNTKRDKKFRSVCVIRKRVVLPSHSQARGICRAKRIASETVRY